MPTHLTTAALSNHSHGNPTLALTNLSGTTASGSGGLTLSLAAGVGGPGGAAVFSAGTSSGSLSSLVFSNSNGVSFGLNGSTITVAHNALTTAMASDAGSIFMATSERSNLISTSQSSLFQPSGAYLTTAMASNAGSGFMSTGERNNYFYTSNNTFLTTAMQSNVSSCFMLTGERNNYFYTSNNTFLTTAMASNAGSNFVATSQSALFQPSGAYLTTAMQSNAGSLFVATSQSSALQHTSVTSAITSNAFPTANTTNLIGSAYTTHSHTQYLTTAMLSDAGSLFQSTGNYLTTAMASNAGSNFVAASAAFSGNNASGTIASNGISISVAAPGGGAAQVLKTFIPGEEFKWAQGSVSLGQRTLYICPAYLPGNLTATCVKLPVMITNSSLASSSGSVAQTIRFGIYTTNSTNSLVLDTHYTTGFTLSAVNSSNVSRSISIATALGNSTSYNYFNTNSNGLSLSSQVHGPRELILPCYVSLTPGPYWFAYHQSSALSGTSNSVFAMSHIVMSSQTQAPFGLATASTTAGGIARDIGMGSYSVTTGGLPNRISFSEIVKAATFPFMILGPWTA